MFIICHYLDDVSKISKAGKILKEKKRLLKNPRYRKIKQRITDMERLKFFRWFMRKAREGGGGVGVSLGFTLVRFPSQHIL